MEGGGERCGGDGTRVMRLRSERRSPLHQPMRHDGDGGGAWAGQEVRGSSTRPTPGSPPYTPCGITSGTLPSGLSCAGSSLNSASTLPSMRPLGCGMSPVPGSDSACACTCDWNDTWLHHRSCARMLKRGKVAGESTQAAAAYTGSCTSSHHCLARTHQPLSRPHSPAPAGPPPRTPPVMSISPHL